MHRGDIGLKLVGMCWCGDALSEHFIATVLYAVIKLLNEVLYVLTYDITWVM